MRTTVTLDDDVAALLRKRQAERKQDFKQALNEALREGLTREVGPRRRSRRPHGKTFSVGALLIQDLDDVSEVLEQLDGPTAR